MAYKELCPMCGGHSYYVTPEKNLKAYCFLCGHADFQGDYKSPERFEDVKGIRQFYHEISRYYHSSLTPNAINYLHNRGITDTQINAYQIGYCPNDDHILYTDPIAKPSGIVSRNKPFLAGRITFPYLAHGQVTDIRGRSLEKDTEYRYLSPKGSSFYRGADYPYMYDGEAILITEGEIKAIFAREAGYTVHGLPGINSMRPKTNGAVVCFDSSKRHKSRYAVFRAIVSLSRVFPYLKVATLPLEASERDIGIDDYILAHGQDSFRRVIQHALPVEKWKRLHVL